MDKFNPTDQEDKSANNDQEESKRNNSVDQNPLEDTGYGITLLR